MLLPLRFIPQTILPYKPKCLTSYTNNLVMSNSDQSKVSPTKTYSEAVSASEGTRSEPSKTAKAVKTVVKKVKKQPKSPEEVPSEWDESNTSSKSEKPNLIGTRIVKTKRTSSSNNRPAAIEKTQAESDPVKNKSDGSLKPTKLSDPLPKADPFKSKEKPSKLIDKDSISHLTFKKVDQAALAVDKAASTKISNNATDQAPRAKEAAVRVDPLSEAAKNFLNGPKTFKEPIDRSTQKSLDNYFVPQGRTVRSVSSCSSDHPGSSATSSSSVIHSDGSDLDIITSMSRNRSHRPALVEAKDLTGAPRGRHSAKVSPSLSSASSSGEAKSGILPTSREDERRSNESRSSEGGIEPSNRPPDLDQSRRIPETIQLESNCGVRGILERGEGTQIQERERIRSDADSSSRSPHATAGGRTVSDPTSRSPDRASASTAGVLPFERLSLSLSADVPANSTLAVPELRSELLNVPAGVLPSSSASSPSGTVSGAPTDKKEGKRSSSEEQSQLSAQQKGKGTKLGTSSQLQSSPSGLKLYERQGKTSASPSTLHSPGDDKTQSHDAGSISSSRVYEKSERRGRESSSTPRGRADSKKLTSEELTQMSQ
ncbi:hypothetical protein PGTUg99_011756 [Puccinia graminis f. sp. tritici]|uniref:Uncharacterized protein n=1 Tax=Puccinia graminis f. sp. tritici TaxID=56615 RepID=A0A5B0NAK2_PUCGR|nr:hypothetical protein PGTUg99_011756 [Puccinia graminis f. sp. tritici]